MTEQLTEAQIANWRRALLPVLGPYALHMPAADIQAYRDRLQAELQAVEEPRSAYEATIQDRADGQW